MLNAYKGKVINGKPALTEIAILPEDADIIITVLPPKDIKKTTKIDEKEIEKRRAMVESLKGCLAGYKISLDEIREERIAKRGLL